MLTTNLFATMSDDLHPPVCHSTPGIPLSPAELAVALCGLPEWRAGQKDSGTYLQKRYAFGDIAVANGFLRDLATLAREFDRSPLMVIAGSTVTVTWSAIETSGICRRDIEMARATDSVVGEIYG